MGARSLTFLALAVPDAEPLVASLRARYDPSATVRGLGAHITLVYPFVDASAVTMNILARLERIVAGLPLLVFTLDCVRSFPTTLYLAPSDPDRIRAVAQALTLGFPEAPGDRARPYTPHLSVARNAGGAMLALADQLTASLAKAGPVRCMCHEVTLYGMDSGRWRPMYAAPFDR